MIRFAANKSVTIAAIPGVIAAWLLLAAVACESAETAPGAPSCSGAVCDAACADDMGCGSFPSRPAVDSGGGGGQAARDAADEDAGSDPASDDGDACFAFTVTAQNRRQSADIIWVVDNSGSMATEIDEVNARMNDFSRQIVQSGIDVRVILISASLVEDPPSHGVCIGQPLGSGSCPDDSNPPGYLHVSQWVDSHNSLDLIASTFASWEQNLRPEAFKTFVVVTDDNAYSGYNFLDLIRGHPDLFESWCISGVFCQTPCPAAAAIGTVYQMLIDQSGGVAADLCEQDFQPVFDRLAAGVILSSDIECRWEIPDPPPGETFDKEMTNVMYTRADQSQVILAGVSGLAGCGTEGGWYFDDPGAPSEITVCPVTCVQMKRQTSVQIDVLFGCETTHRTCLPGRNNDFRFTGVPEEC